MPTARRIMVLGAGGQVGQALRAEALPEDWHLASYFRADLDITDHAAVRNEMRRRPPDLVINAAGMTNVDAAERDPDAAIASNFHAVANLAAQCSALDVPLVHLSTDYVFDGKPCADGELRPYRPDDPMNPINAYGQSKMMGEEAIRHDLAWHVILRISWVFSGFGNNSLKSLVNLMGKHDELRFVNDQTGCPTPASDVAAALVRISTAILNGKTDGFGTFHYCGSPQCSRFELAEMVAKIYNAATGRNVKIHPADSAEFSHLAPRPAHSALDCSGTAAAYGIAQPLWKDSLGKEVAACLRQTGVV